MHANFAAEHACPGLTSLCVIVPAYRPRLPPARLAVDADVSPPSSGSTDGTFALPESGAILFYLAAAKAGPGGASLLPADPAARAECLSWVFYQSVGAGGLGRMFFCFWGGFGVGGMGGNGWGRLGGSGTRG